MKALLAPDRYRVTAWVLGAVALVSPLIVISAFLEDRDPDTLAFVLWLVVPNALAGLILSWRWVDMPHPLSKMAGKRYQRYQVKVERGLIDALLVLIIQFVGVLVIQVVTASLDNEWDEFFVGPLLITACAGIPLFLAVLLGMLVITPLRILGSAAIILLSGGRVDSARPAFALLLLLLVPFAVLAVLAGYSVPEGTGTYRNAAAGVVFLARLMFTVVGTPEQQVLAWIARLLVVLMALCLGWLARLARRRGSARQ